MKMEIAAIRAMTPPIIEAEPLLRAGMNVFSPYHRKNRIVIQSAIADQSIALSSKMALF
jgi:hypothetical protein